MSAAAREGDWKAAEDYSAMVIENYKIETSSGVLASLFSTSNVQYTTKNNLCALRLATERICGIGGQFTSIWGLNNAQQPSADLWDLYADNDIRKQAWFVEAEEEGVKRVYVSKPQVSSWGPAGDVLVLYRKAEMYLINCEAKCRQGFDDEAAEMLFKFRQQRIPGYNEPIGNNVLDERAAVMLLLIEGLGIVQGNIGNLAEALGQFIITGAENSILKVIAAGNDSLECTLAKGEDPLTGVGHSAGHILPAFAQKGNIRTGNHITVGIDHAKGMLGNISQLKDHILKYTVCHFLHPP